MTISSWFNGSDELKNVHAVNNFCIKTSSLNYQLFMFDLNFQY